MVMKLYGHLGPRANEIISRRPLKHIITPEPAPERQVIPRLGVLIERDRTLLTIFFFQEVW